jgi:hypothetical protein
MHTHKTEPLPCAEQTSINTLQLGQLHHITLQINEGFHYAASRYR